MLPRSGNRRSPTGQNLMQISLWRRCSAIAVVCGSALCAQTKVDLHTQTKNVDFSNAASTKPATVGASLPAACGQGQFFFLSTGPAGQNLYGCSAANVWSLEGAAIPQASLVPSELNNAGAFLTTDGTNPIWQQLAGDVTGAPSAVTVTGLQTRPVANTAPTNGQLLGWSASSTTWLPLTVATPPNFGTTFNSTTVLAIPGTAHNLNTPNLLVGCYDNASPANMIEPSNITVNQATFDVAISFLQPQTGRCVVNGSGGLSSGGSGGGGGASGAGMAAQLGDFAVSMNNPNLLTIGALCSLTTPCNVRFGTVTYSITQSSTVTLSGGTATAYIYLTSDGTLNVGSSSLTLTCSSGCNVQNSVSQFPINSIPVFTWNASGGTWAAGGGFDQRAFLSAKSLAAGTGVVILESGTSSTISVDSSVVPTYLTGSALLNFPSIGTGACSSDENVSVPGANPGDGIAAGWPALPQGFIGMMRVSSSGVVSVRLCNFSGASATVSGLTYTATIVRGS